MGPIPEASFTIPVIIMMTSATSLPQENKVCVLVAHSELQTFRTATQTANNIIICIHMDVLGKFG